MLPHPLAPVSTRSLAGYCDKRITRSSLPASVRRVSLDECERKLVILNRILRLSFLSTSDAYVSGNCFKERSLSSSSTVFLFLFFLSFVSKKKIQMVLSINDSDYSCYIYGSQKRLTPIFRKKFKEEKDWKWKKRKVKRLIKNFSKLSLSNELNFKPLVTFLYIYIKNWRNNKLPDCAK